MAPPGDAPTPATRGGNDWTTEVADTIERVVGGIRDKTAVPLTTVARGLVFGLLAAVMGTAALAFVAIGLVRAVNAYLPEDVWAAHLLVGGIFTLVGALLLSRATSRKVRR